MVTTTYAIALGSNRPGRHGMPADEVRAAVAALGDGVRGVSAIITTAPLGPSIRAFANAVVLVESAMAPPAMLRHLKAIERAFGRRRGRRWGARVIDLDIVLWSGGRWRSAGLVVPHALRLLIGNDQRILLPASVFFGGAALVLADVGARTVLAPVQLPVGVATAIVGVPVFLYLLNRSRA